MALTIGSRLGAYEIISPLGTGGMGEVYRARDTRLKREVAIKVLPDGFSKDADRLARFQREAEVLATLNHPNIAAVYGLETYAAQPPGTSLALSPDGTVLAFIGRKSGGNPQLCIRRLGQLPATLLPGTDGARDPFFSPDGQWIAFFADGKLKKISVTGGAAVNLCDAPSDRGGAWGEDGNIVFAPSPATGVTLQRVSSAGGKAEQLTTLGQGESIHRWPQVLPGAKAILYTAAPSNAGFDNASIVVQPLPAGPSKVVQRRPWRQMADLDGWRHMAHMVQDPARVVSLGSRPPHHGCVVRGGGRLVESGQAAALVGPDDPRAASIAPTRSSSRRRAIRCRRDSRDSNPCPPRGFAQ